MTFEGQTLTLILLSVFAPLGAFDVLYFHIYRFRLACRPASHGETLTHIARSLVIAFVVPMVALYEVRGAWFWLIAVLLVVDLVNNLADGFLEQESRAAYGGLPRGEYMIHLLGSSGTGAASLAFLVLGWSGAFASTALVASAVPGWLQLNGLAIGIGSLVLATLEGGLVLHARSRIHRGLVPAC